MSERETKEAGEGGTEIAALRVAAEAGDAQAMFDLAEALTEGRDVNMDNAAAVKWFERAAEAGHAEAMFHIAGALWDRDCKCVPHDNESKTRAVALFRRSVEAGFVPSMVALGDALMKGEDSTKEDREEAMTLYRRAAETGEMGAMRAYAEVLEDEEEAAKWFRRSTKPGCIHRKMSLMAFLATGV